MSATTKQLIETLKDAEQDFEWYPTTREILGAVVADLKKVEYQSAKIDGRFYSAGHRSYGSLLDIGAGNGQALALLAEYFTKRSEGRRCFHELYAIEKSPILCGQLPDHVMVVGTELEQQSLLSKKVDVIFSNLPYSIFEQWAVKIIREAAAPLVYLVVPQRWEESAEIAAALAFRDAKAHVVGNFDFEKAERQARCKVHVVRVELSQQADDAFERFFDEQFADLRAKFDAQAERAKKGKAGDEDEAERKTKSKFSALVVGENYPAALVALYVQEMANIQRNYALISELDADLLREFNVTPATVMACLKQRLAGLRQVYWTELFGRMSVITDRLTSKKRDLLLKTLQEHVHVDFTVDNIHAVIIWALKNANRYLDAQLIETFEQMVDRANVRNYKSNQRAFVADRWRYNQEKEEHTHFCLEYRLVLQSIGGIDVSWSGRRELSARASMFLGDLLTVARNLSFQCATNDQRLWQREGWVSNKLVTFHFHNVTTKKVEPLFEVRAFQNGNCHVRLHQRFALALNVEYGRLKGWVKSGEEASAEMADPDAAALFKTHFTLPTTGNPLRLMAGDAEPAPPAEPEPEPEPAEPEPAEPEPEHEPEPEAPPVEDVAPGVTAQLISSKTTMKNPTVTSGFIGVRLSRIPIRHECGHFEARLTRWGGASNEAQGFIRAGSPCSTCSPQGRPVSRQFLTLESVAAFCASENTPAPSTEPTDPDSMKRFNPHSGKSEPVAAPAAVKPSAAPRKRSATVPDTGDLKQALTLLWAHTGHTGDFWRLMGPANVGHRAEIMHALMGRRIPQKECGLTVLRDLIYGAVGVNEWTTTCENDRSAQFADYLAGFVGAPPPANGRSRSATPPPVAAPALSNAPASPFVLAAAKSALARSAAAVPPATYAALVPGLTLDAAADHRFAFAFWCEEHAASFSDWRKAHLAYLHPKVAIEESHLAPYPADDTEKAPEETQAPEAPPSNIVPFVQPATADGSLAALLATLR